MENGEFSREPLSGSGVPSPVMQKARKKNRKPKRDRKALEEEVGPNPVLKKPKNSEKSSLNIIKNVKKRKMKAISGSTEKPRPASSSSGKQKEPSVPSDLSDRKAAKLLKKSKKASAAKAEKNVVREKEKQPDEERTGSSPGGSAPAGPRIDQETAERNRLMREELKEKRYSLHGSVVDISDSEASERGCEEDVRRPGSRKGSKSSAKNRATPVPVATPVGASFDEGAEEQSIADELRNRVRRGQCTLLPRAGQGARLIEKFNGRMSPHTFLCRSLDDRILKPSNHTGDNINGPESGDEEDGSIRGQSSGPSNSTWVQCDRCKKWRRLRGAVDAEKLPSKWYCTMNKTDPERARCNAPEEEYHDIPESAEENRTRKHLRLWVRRLKGYEAFEVRMPTMTRGKKKAVTTGCKEPYEWIRCCNPSCGKWRAILRFMDAEKDREWYCVLNTWDEKTASCAAPQENLPAIGCPLWVMKDDD